MRQIFSGVFLVFALLWSPTLVVAESCIACRYFDALAGIGDPDMFTGLMEQLEKQEPATVTLGQGAFCKSGAGETVANALTEAADRQFLRAEQIAAKSNRCSKACAPKLNEAEYCAYRSRLATDRYRLGAVALRLADLAEIYARAGQEERLPLEVLSADMTLYAGEALNVLEDALTALTEGNANLVPDVRWQASSTEVSGLLDALSLLADFSLIQGDTIRLEAALGSAADELSALREETVVALTRARVLQPAERRNLAARILSTASNISFVIASLQTSADAQLAGADATRSTNANAVPAGRDPLSLQGTVGCLNRLSLNAFTGSEAPDMASDILNDCRSFDGCPVRESGRSRSSLSPLRAFLESQDEAEKQTFALVRSMCAAN